MRMELVTQASDPAAAHALDDGQTLTLDAASGDPAAAAHLPAAQGADSAPDAGTASTPCTWTGVHPVPLTLTF